MSKHAHVFTAMVLLLLVCPAVLRGQAIVVKSAELTQHILVDLPAGSYASGAEYALVNADDPDSPLPAQLIHALRVDGTVDASRYQVLASIPASDSPVAKQVAYQLTKLPRRTMERPFMLVKAPRSMRLVENDKEAKWSHSIWEYKYDTIVDESVPKDDPRGSRSCYMHPIWGMDGEILSDDFPKDHYHHHGIFWTWPYVKVGDQTYDLWMSTNIQQRFIKWLATDTGPVAAVLGVENGWFVEQRQVATERVWVRTYRSETDCRAFDITLVIQALDEPVTLQGREHKSYGGFTFRFDVSPRSDATVRVPKKTLGFGAPDTSGDPDLVNTRLPWADLSTHIPGAPQRSGAAVFVSPSHPDYPPTWLTRTYGALCVGWPGVESYTIAAGKSVRLDYRVWIHRGEPDPQQLDRQCRAYCQTQ